MRTFVLAVLCSCTTSSATLQTKAITAHFSIEADGDPVAKATKIDGFLLDDLNDVILSAGDSLEASTDKDAKLAMPKTDTNFYRVVITGAADRNEVAIKLLRSSGTSALGSSAKVPSPIVLTAPTPNFAYSVATGALPMKWSNVDSGAIVCVFSYPCNGIALKTTRCIDDTGAYDLAPAEAIVGAPPASGQCTRLRIRREKNGIVDPAFAPKSKFVATRFDYIDINVTP